MTKKRFCVLQVTPVSPNSEHLSYFANKDECDFYFVTHDVAHPDALKFCPHTRWSETRNTLAKLVPKKYDYYAFIDYDYILRPQRDLSPLQQILEDLEYNPAVLTYYPGNNLITPYATDVEYFESRDYSCIPFTHAGLKIVHHSLMRWFFPLCVNFSIDVEACHMFNIQEIPFLKNVMCSHKMLYDNGHIDPNASYNKDGAYSKYKMDEMWRWLRPFFRKTKILDLCATSEAHYNDSLLIKESLVRLLKPQNITFEAQRFDIDYYVENKEKIADIFDLKHEFFKNKDLDLETQFLEINTTVRKQIEVALKDLVSFGKLKQRYNPWIEIIQNINEKLVNSRCITINECLEIYQQMDGNKSLFHKNCKVNKDLWAFLKDKRVAFVGPAPYLSGLAKGGLIDSYDVVVRIQHGISDKEDYGSRTDIIQSCLNSTYGPPLIKYLENLKKTPKPAFVLCNDTVCQTKYFGAPPHLDSSWNYTDEIYEPIFKRLDIPFVHLGNKDGSWDRWSLYWEIYAKEHVENFGNNKYTHHTGNFNSGYGALNFLLRYPIKELAVFGVDFYNTGVPQSNAEKYTQAYIDSYGGEEQHLGPSAALHDQLSQMMHCKNILLKDRRFNLDPVVKKKLLSDQATARLAKFKLLPKFQNETR